MMLRCLLRQMFRKRRFQIIDDIPEPHLSLAISDMMFFHNFTEAQASIQKALALDPNSAYAHDIASWFANVMGAVQRLLLSPAKR
jgi:Tfp pilus assembly protein PilF